MLHPRARVHDDSTTGVHPAGASSPRLRPRNPIARFDWSASHMHRDASRTGVAYTQRRSRTSRVYNRVERISESRAKEIRRGEIVKTRRREVRTRSE